MSLKIEQKKFLKGSRSFEIKDDQVDLIIELPFQKKETLTVMLAILDPEPSIDSQYMHFKSRVNGEALVSLFLGKPNSNEFDSFVKILKDKILAEYNDFAGLKQKTHDSLVYDEPPEFDDDQPTIKKTNIDTKRVEESIDLIKTNIQDEKVLPFISALENLIDKPNDVDNFEILLNEFNQLGFLQGAVLTYAPYVSVLLADDPLNI